MSLHCCRLSHAFRGEPETFPDDPDDLIPATWRHTPAPKFSPRPYAAKLNPVNYLSRQQLCRSIPMLVLLPDGERRSLLNAALEFTVRPLPPGHLLARIHRLARM